MLASRSILPEAPASTASGCWKSGEDAEYAGPSQLAHRPPSTRSRRGAPLNPSPLTTLRTRSPASWGRRRRRGLEGRNRGPPPISARQVASGGHAPAAGRTWAATPQNFRKRTLLRGRRKRTIGLRGEGHIQSITSGNPPPQRSPSRRTARREENAARHAGRTPSFLQPSGSVCGFRAPVCPKSRPSAGRREV